MLFYCIAEAKYWGEDTVLPHVTQFQNSRRAMQQSPISPRRSSCSSMDFRDAKIWHRWGGFSWYFSYPCQYPYTSATYLYYDHRRRHIISCLCSVLNWNICRSHCYNINESLAREVCVCRSRFFRIRVWVWTSVRFTWSDRYWYIIIPVWTFPGITPRLCGKVILKRRGISA
jgi:hypothetical protein